MGGWLGMNALEGHVHPYFLLRSGAYFTFLTLQRLFFTWPFCKFLFKNALLLLSWFRRGNPRGRAGATGPIHGCKIDAWRICHRGRVHYGISNRTRGQIWICRTNSCRYSNNIWMNKNVIVRSGWVERERHLNNLHKSRWRNLRGVAILVPLIVLVAVVSVFQAEVIPKPGAYTSTHEPQLLKLDL